MVEPGRSGSASGAGDEATGEDYVVEVSLEGDSAGTGGELRSARAELRDTGRELKQEVRDQKQALKQQVRQKAEELKGRATERAEERKGAVAEKASHFASALHTAGSKLEEEGEEALARFTHQAAEQVDRLTHYLRENDMGGLMRNLEEMGRGNPAVLVGGTFAAGMLLGRFLRSSSPTDDGFGDAGYAPGTFGRGTSTGYNGGGMEMGDDYGATRGMVPDSTGGARSRGRINMEVD